jgi:hypothetical protein
MRARVQERGGCGFPASGEQEGHDPSAGSVAAL